MIRETDKKQTWESGSLPDAFNFLDPDLKTKSDSIQTATKILNCYSKFSKGVHFSKSDIKLLFFHRGDGEM